MFLMFHVKHRAHLIALTAASHQVLLLVGSIKHTVERFAACPKNAPQHAAPLHRKRRQIRGTNRMFHVKHHYAL